jgi:hypothetical protein
MQKIKTWLKNNKEKQNNPVDPEPKKFRAKFVKTWDFHAVVSEKMKTQINDRIMEVCGATPGSQRFIAEYKRACKYITENLSPEQKTEFEKLAVEWNSGKMADQLKSRYVTRHC